MARNNNYRRGCKNDFVPEKDRVYFCFSDPLYKRLYRNKSSRLDKMRTGNKTKSSSRIKIIEVASSCCGSLYELYRRKVSSRNTCGLRPQGIFRRPATGAAPVTSVLIKIKPSKSSSLFSFMKRLTLWCLFLYKHTPYQYSLIKKACKICSNINLPHFDELLLANTTSKIHAISIYVSSPHRCTNSIIQS